MSARFVYLAVISFLLTGTSLAEDPQKQLDAACEAAREKKLAPMQAKLIDECVEKDRKASEYCTQYYENWDGNRGAGLSKLFYDLPECEAAFTYQRDNTKR